MKEELISKNGYFERFSKYFAGEISPESPKKILFFKFFRDLEKQGIPKKIF